MDESKTEMNRRTFLTATPAAVAVAAAGAQAAPPVASEANKPYTGPYKHLFSPVKFGTMTLKNRIVQPPHSPLFSTEPHLEAVPGQRMADYLARRAEGGAAMVCSGTSYSVADAFNAGGGKIGYRIGNTAYSWILGQSDGEQEENFRKYVNVIADAVHAAGGKYLMLLGSGPSRINYGYTQVSRPDYLLMSSSQTPDFISSATPREFETEDIQGMVKAIGELAAVMRSTRIDGIEFHASAGELHGQFLSPASNRRTDKYGGSLENRMRFTVDSIKEVRKRIGDDFPLSLRISVREGFEGGLKLDGDGVEICRRIEAERLVDMFAVTVAPITTSEVVPDQSRPPATYQNDASVIREALRHGTPVLCNGRIENAREAEQIIADGNADLVGMNRALIADPDLPNKSREGRQDEVRHCTFAAEGCIGLINTTRTKGINCTVNPETGRERAHRLLAPIERKKKVLVIGGGPAGLKAAEQAAARGHEVVVCERESELGGQIVFQTKVASRVREKVLIDHLALRMKQLGVTVRLNQDMTAEKVLAEHPDVVVIATGAFPNRTGYTNQTPYLASLPGADQSFVMTGVDVLKGLPAGKRVVLLEDSSGGDLKASIVIEYLLARGHEVRVLTTAATIGTWVYITASVPMYRRLYGKGMKLSPFTAVRKIGDRTLTAYNIHSLAEEEITGFDTVVLELGYRTDRGIVKALKGKVPEIYEAGDVVMPRSITAAITEGYTVGRMF